MRVGARDNRLREQLRARVDWFRRESRDSQVLEMHRSRGTERRDIPGCPREMIIIFVWVRSFWINRQRAPWRVSISPPRVVSKNVTVGIRRNFVWAWTYLYLVYCQTWVASSCLCTICFIFGMPGLEHARDHRTRTSSLAFIILARRRPGVSPGIMITYDRYGDWWNPYGGNLAITALIARSKSARECYSGNYKCLAIF